MVRTLVVNVNNGAIFILFPTAMLVQCLQRYGLPPVVVMCIMVAFGTIERRWGLNRDIFYRVSVLRLGFGFELRLRVKFKVGV